jgi:hypothetical protein
VSEHPAKPNSVPPAFWWKPRDATYEPGDGFRYSTCRECQRKVIWTWHGKKLGWFHA